MRQLVRRNRSFTAEKHIREWNYEPARPAPEPSPDVINTEMGLPVVEPASDLSRKMEHEAEREPQEVVPVTARPKEPRDAGRSRRSGSARVYEPQPDPRRGERPVEIERKRFPWLLLLIPLIILAGFTIGGLLNSRPARPQVIVVPGGDAVAGQRAIQSWGCGSCHTIPGVPGAYGKVGPELDQMAEQTFIAGMLPNTPENMIRWIMEPQEVQPGNAMPNTGVTLEMARNMAAYLYSIR